MGRPFTAPDQAPDCEEGSSLPPRGGPRAPQPVGDNTPQRSGSSSDDDDDDSGDDPAYGASPAWGNVLPGFQSGFIDRGPFNRDDGEVPALQFDDELVWPHILGVARGGRDHQAALTDQQESASAQPTSGPPSQLTDSDGDDEDDDDDGDGDDDEGDNEDGDDDDNGGNDGAAWGNVLPGAQSGYLDRQPRERQDEEEGSPALPADDDFVSTGMFGVARGRAAHRAALFPVVRHQQTPAPPPRPTQVRGTGEREVPEEGEQEGLEGVEGALRARLAHTSAQLRAVTDEFAAYRRSTAATVQAVQAEVQQLRLGAATRLQSSG